MVAKLRFRKRRGNRALKSKDAVSCIPGELNLACLSEGQEAVIASVPDMPLFPPLGLRPGKKVKVCAKGCFGGPIIAEVDRRNIALGRCLAREVRLHGSGHLVPEGDRVRPSLKMQAKYPNLK